MITSAYVLFLSWIMPMPELQMISLEQCVAYGNSFLLTHTDSSYFCANKDYL